MGAAEEGVQASDTLQVPHFIKMVVSKDFTRGRKEVTEGEPTASSLTGGRGCMKQSSQFASQDLSLGWHFWSWLGEPPFSCRLPPSDCPSQLFRGEREE